MSDYLVNAASKPTLRKFMGALGIPTPVELARAEGPYQARFLEGQRVLFGARPGAGARAASRARTADPCRSGRHRTGAAIAPAARQHRPRPDAQRRDGAPEGDACAPQRLRSWHPRNSRRCAGRCRRRCPQESRLR